MSIIGKLQQYGISVKPGGDMDLQGEIFARNLPAPSGTTYYVDGNKSTSGNGSSWRKAFSTLTEAITASHANIAVAARRAWATRNRIYVIGDALDEDLTTFPQKTDIIGLGSYNNNPRCGLIGTHAVATAAAFGCRWFNFEFRDDGATANFTMTGGGYEFHNCLFRATANSTYGIVGTAPSDVKIIGCHFLPDTDGDPFDTAAIGFTTAGYNCQIKDSIIWGDIGIAITDSGTFQHCIIENNFIHAVTLCVDDNSDDWFLSNNRLVSEAADGGATAPGCMDANLFKSVGNILAGADSNGPWPNLDEHS